MTIDAHMLQKDKWVLGRNRRELNDGGPLIRNESRHFDFDGYWSGDKLVKGTRNAATFTTEAEAVEYLEANIARVDA